MNEFLIGFIKGAKETPKGFFSSAAAIWRLSIGTTESLVCIPEKAGDKRKR